MVTQPIYTDVSGVLGRKIPLYIAFFLFSVGSIVFALADTMSLVLGGRILQGLRRGRIGCSRRSHPGRPDHTQRVPAISWSLLVGDGRRRYIWTSDRSRTERGCLLLIDRVDQPPIGAVAFSLSFFFLRLRPIDQSFGSKLRRLDWIDMFLFAVVSTAFSLPLSWAGSIYPWSS